MLSFLLQSLALRFLIFDYYLSPVQIYLQTATNPILKALTGCVFCQGCEAGFVVQLLYCDYTPKGLAIAFLNGISAGFVAMSWANWENGRGDAVDWGDDADQIVVDDDPLKEQAEQIQSFDFLSVDEKADLLTELYEAPPEGTCKKLLTRVTTDILGRTITTHASIINAPID